MSLHLINELGDPNFLLLKSNKQAKMKVSAKIKRSYLERIQIHLKFPIFKVAMNLVQKYFFTLGRKIYLSVLITLHFAMFLLQKLYENELLNRLFPSSFLPPRQSESKCEVFVMVIRQVLLTYE